MRHPYSRYGYVAAVVMGLLGWAIASEEKRHPRERQAERQAQGGGGGK